MCMYSIGHVLRPARVEVRLVWQLRGIHHAACAGERSDASSTATVPCPFPMAGYTILYVCYAQNFSCFMFALYYHKCQNLGALVCGSCSSQPGRASRLRIAHLFAYAYACMRVRCQDRYAKPCSAHSARSVSNS